MNVEYINPFVKASSTILKSVVNMDVSIGRLYIKNSPYSSETIAVVIGFMGSIKGQVIISMDHSIAKKIASTMMGMTIDRLDELSRSAITEVVNMMLGSAATLLSERDINIEITPPSLFMGDNMEIATPNIKSVCVPLNIQSGGVIELNIALAK